MTITDQLIAFSSAKVPDNVRAMVTLSLFDWAACGIAGAQDAAFANFKQITSGQGGITLLGGGQSDAAGAALINGTLSHALDYDDTHFAHIGHPSVAVIPAVLALAEETGADMAALIDAVSIGVEASVLVGLWLGRDHYQVGYHQTATAGAFGATLGAARLLGLDNATTRQALGLCASMASGIKAQFGTMAKPLNAGLAARTGVEAALWARAGVTAAQDGLAGPLGFGATHHGADATVTLPGAAWHFLTVSHKFHACCHGLHAMLEALAAPDFTATQVAKLHIHTHPRWMSVCNIVEPDTGLAAKFSYRQTAAMALLGHETGAIGSYTDSVTSDPNIRSLRALIDVSEDAQLSETQARIDVTLTDGTAQTLFHDLLAPLTLATRTDKLRKKASALLSPARAEALWLAAQGDQLGVFTDQLVMS